MLRGREQHSAARGRNSSRGAYDRGPSAMLENGFWKSCHVVTMLDRYMLVVMELEATARESEIELAEMSHYLDSLHDISQVSSKPLPTEIVMTNKPPFPMRNIDRKARLVISGRLAPVTLCQILSPLFIALGLEARMLRSIHDAPNTPSLFFTLTSAICWH